MDPLLEEYLVMDHQREIERESCSRQKQAENIRVNRSNLSTRVMRGFGQWMIEKGEGLVKRYEVVA